MENKQYYSVLEAAKYLKMTKQGIYYLIKEKLITCCDVKGKVRIIEKSELDKRL